MQFVRVVVGIVGMQPLVDRWLVESGGHGNESFCYCHNTSLQMQWN